jgi:internalin A
MFRPHGRDGDSNVASRPLHLVFIYSHKDRGFRNQLEVHLALYKRIGVISTWHDMLIGAGREWQPKIFENLDLADIILMLVSADFLASDYCYGVELTRALERHEAGEARVIPVLVRDVALTDAPFAKLQWLPRNGKPIKRWADRDAALKDVTEGIRMAAMELHSVNR